MNSIIEAQQTLADCIISGKQSSRELLEAKVKSPTNLSVILDAHQEYWERMTRVAVYGQGEAKRWSY